MRLETPMLFLFAFVVGTQASCSADSAMDPGPPVAEVTVALDTSMLSVGHTAQASATVKDSAGNAIEGQTVSWASQDTAVAKVSAEGAVTALAAGSTEIQGRISGKIGSAGLTVVGPPDLAFHDFNDGTLGPSYSNPYRADLDFPDDPTGLGRGKVARFHYVSTTGSVDRALYYGKARRYGEPMYFSGDFYIATNDMGGGSNSTALLQRKLVYWQSHVDYSKYTTGHGGVNFRTVVSLFGDKLLVDATFNPAVGNGNSDTHRTHGENLATIAPNTWYTLEVFQQLESSIGAHDGVIRVWLNGSKVFDRTTLQWTDPGWVGATGDYTGSWGAPMSAQDIYFDTYLVGEQYDNHTITNFPPFDEYRYWDNVGFSRQPIGQ